MQGSVVSFITHIENFSDQFSSFLLILSHDLLIDLGLEQVSHFVHYVETLLGIDCCGGKIVESVQLKAEVVEIIVLGVIFKPDVQQGYCRLVRSGQLI